MGLTIKKYRKSNEVYREGPSLSAQILNEKSAFSPATVVFESKTNTNQERIGYLVYPEITQMIERSL